MPLALIERGWTVVVDVVPTFPLPSRPVVTAVPRMPPNSGGATRVRSTGGPGMLAVTAMQTSVDAVAFRRTFEPTIRRGIAPLPSPTDGRFGMRGRGLEDRCRLGEGRDGPLGLPE